MVLAFKFSMYEQIINKRSHNQLMNRLNRETLNNHANNVLPKHFEKNAMTSPGGSYGYKPRSLKYQRYKGRKTGQTAPLVFSGKLRAAILGSIKVRATRNGGSIQANGYRVLMRNKRKDNADQSGVTSRPILALNPQLKKEIEIVSPHEQDTTAREFARKYVDLANNDPQYAKLKRIK